MKLILNKVQSDENVTINYVEMNDEVEGLISYINNYSLVGYIDEDIYNIELKKIYYIEAIDNKVFIYTKNNCYITKKKLYEIEELKINNFVRISKSIIVNIKKIDHVKADISGKLITTLINGEKINISRKYKNSFKERIGM